MKKICYLILAFYGFISCSKSIYGEYQFKNDYAYHLIKLNKDLSFEYIINEHMIGYDTLIGTWYRLKDTILIIKKSNNKSRIINDSYNSGCIKIVDNWNNPLHGVLIKINGLSIFKADNLGKICNKNAFKNISKIQVFYSYSRDKM